MRAWFLYVLTKIIRSNGYKHTPMLPEKGKRERIPFLWSWHKYDMLPRHKHIQKWKLQVNHTYEFGWNKNTSK